MVTVGKWLPSVLPVHTPLLVEIKCIYGRRNTTVFQIVEEINYMFWTFSGWAIIRLKLEISEKTYTLRYGPHNKNGATRSRSPILDV
jgi:hypothetical protein